MAKRNGSNKTALLVVDVQAGIMDGRTPYTKWPYVLERIGLLVARAKRAGAPVIFVQHDGEAGDRLEPGTKGWELHPALDTSGAAVIVRKTASDSFYETVLEHELEARGIGTLVVVGCMTQNCVDSTSRRAVSLGFDVLLARDAHATADTPLLKASEIIEHHNYTLDGINAGDAEITVRDSDEILFE
jgi:nicotinamidase-related amidase